MVLIFNASTAGPGTHVITYTYTDANGCTNTATDNIDVYGFPSIDNVTTSDVTLCNSPNGTITVSASGGTGSFEYRLDAGAWQASNVFTGLASGSYNLSVRNDNGFCTTVYSSNPVIINDPPTISATAVVTSNYNGVDISCVGAADGNAQASGSGGTAPYTYAWSNGQSGPDLINVVAGTYTVTVTDAGGCQNTASITLNDPPALGVSATFTDVTCYGGSDGAVDVTAIGGVGAYTYSWNDMDPEAFWAFDGTTNDITGNGHHASIIYGNENYSNDAVDGPSSYYFDGVSAIAYDDNVAFMESAFTERTVTMWIKPDALVGRQILYDEGGRQEGIGMQLNGDKLQASVRSSFIERTAFEMTFPNDGQWHQVGFVYDNGAFTLMIDGVMGPTNNTGFSTILMLAPPWNQCGLGSKLGEDAFGGYTWSAANPYAGLMDNVSYHTSALNSDQLANNFTDNGDRTGLPAGDYKVYVYDLNRCIDSVTLTISQPDSLALIFNVSDISCNGGSDGSIDMTVNGGTGPYTYNWSNSAASEDISSLNTGTYVVTVTDANNCSVVDSTSVYEPPVLTASAAITSNYNGYDVSCFGATDGQATVTANGGTLPYTYLWSNGQTTANLVNVGAGSYTVTITDANGCTTTASVTLSNPPQIAVNTSVSSNYGGEDISCVGASDGAASAVASNGIGSYTYLWSNGQSGANLSNVGAGTYTVTATDDNGCTATANVTLSDPPAINLTATVSSDYNGADVSCAGASDGSALATASGGIGSFTYAWSNGQTGANLVNVAAGTYTVTATDAFGCSSVESVTLANPASVDVSIGATSDYNGYGTSCLSGTDGSATAVPSGGVGGYTYSWSNGQSNATLSNVSAGTYTVTVSDANGCTAETSVSFTEPPALTVTLSSAAPSDCGVADGIILANASGGVGTYEYSLDGVNFQSANSFTGLTPGNYFVSVRNTYGTCTVGPTAVNINPPETPTIDNLTIINPTTAVSTDGGILVDASGNGISILYRIPEVSSSWQTSSLFTNLSVGTYTVEVRYYNQSCISSTIATLVAGGGVVGGGSGITFCSGDVTATQFVETYYIPGPEDQLLTTFQTINPLSCGFTSYSIDPVLTYISIGIVEDGTILYYDHWEDGYEPNLSFPIQSTTEIWGDGNTANGFHPDFPLDVLSAADIIVLSNPVTSTTRAAVIDFDGGDKIGARGNLAISRLAWAEDSETLMAGALEVYPKEAWGTDYVFPVGENADVNQMFSYTGAIIMAENDNTTVSYDHDNDGSFNNVVLNEGESLHIDGGINAGGIINADKNVQVHLMTGDRCMNFESRFFTLKPLSEWDNDYYCPVSTENTGAALTSGTNHPTYVHLYNPNAGAITINWETSGGAQPAINVAAGGTAFVEIPYGSGAHFYAAAGNNFYAIATIDSDPDDTTNGWRNSAHDWGFALLPERHLTSQITMVGLAPGMDPYSTDLCCNGWNWTIFDFDSENVGSGDLATNAIDGDINTFWHTDFSGTPGYPHHIEIDLGGTNTFTGFRYTPRQDGSTNGTIADYELQFWNGGGYTTITTGTWASNTDVKSIYFPAVTARYVRLVANSEINGNAWASAAELEVLRPENSAPIWITADYPSGSSSSGNITICIDHDGDGGSLVDANGITYDESRVMAELAMAMIYDPDDNDQTGTRIWVCDGSDAILAGAWGQDPATASPASPAVDMGTGLPNGIPYAVSKCADLATDINGNGLFDECDEVTYTIMVKNTGVLPLSTGSIRIIDTIPNELTYIDNSTFAIIGSNVTGISDDSSPASAFPFDETGYQYNAIVLPGDSLLFKFNGVINNLPSAVFVNNIAYISSNGQTMEAEVSFPVQDPIDPFIAFAQADTTVSCDAVPPALVQDTCLQTGFIPQYNFSTYYVDSENTSAANEGASAAFDGDPLTYWRTDTVSNPAHPHELQIDLGATYEIYGFSYIPRQLSDGGRIANFEFYVSTDGSSWGTAVASGTWPNSGASQTESFAATSGRYVRIRALSEVNGNPWAAIAELNVTACQINTVFSESSTQTGNSSCTDDSYQITRTWITTDFCGNVFTESQVITVEDNTDPVLVNIPPNITVTSSTIPYPPVLDCSAPGNLSLGKPAIQSSTANGGIASLAVDGNTDGDFANGSVIHTASEFQPWWEVDLQGVHPIEEIDIWNRTDCCAARLSNYYVLLSSVPFASTDLTTTLADPNVQSYFRSSAAGTPTTVTIDSTARYIRIQLQGTDILNLAEVVVTPQCISVSDNCDADVQINFTEDNNPVGCAYTITRTWTATDNCGNTTSQVQTIDVSSTLSITADITSDYNGEDVSCDGATDGTASVSIDGGVSPLTVNWSNGQSGNVAVNLSGSTYYVTVTDANGCTAVDSVSLQPPPDITINANITSDHNGEDVSCFGASDGSGFANATGGTGSITYAWSNGQNTASATGLSAGTYSVTATDANGCTAVTSITLQNPPVLSVSANVTSNYNGADVSCFGAADGSAEATASGGIGVISYNWSNSQTGATITNLLAGTYTVTATDQNGCVAIASVTLDNPTPISISVSSTTDPSLCEASDGSITVSASGGAGAYQYRLGLAGTWQNSNVFAGLTAGSYDIYVRNSDGSCETGPETATLTDPIPQACPILLPADTLTYCNTNIAVSFNIAALPDATSYTWSVPAGAIIVLGQGTDSIVVNMNSIPAGSYNVCVVTNSNCGVSPQCCVPIEIIGCSEICDNGIDDDQDGLTDCDDLDCGAPIANPASLTACDNSNETGSGRFFLHDANNTVTTASGVAISYHPTQSDADNDTNTLISPYTSASGTVYVRVENISTACYNTNTITLTVGAKCPENCSNNKDEDGDGLSDCEDPDCPCCESYAPSITKD